MTTVAQAAHTIPMIDSIVTQSYIAVSDLLIAGGSAHLGQEIALRIHIPEGFACTVSDDVDNSIRTKIALTFIIAAEASLEYRYRFVAIHDRVNSACMVHRSITFVLAGRGAKADARCVCYGTTSDVFTFVTLQEHNAPETSSSVVVKSVLTDQARLVSRSLIKVTENGKHTQAEQVNKNILLSSTAKAVSIPMLEVATNDVSCKHGAAVSRFGDEQKFYLQSKGIAAAAVEQLLLEAFLQ